MARAWVALAKQQRRLLRGAMPNELGRLQQDLQIAVLNRIRELVVKRKQALGVGYCSHPLHTSNYNFPVHTSLSL